MQRDYCDVHFGLAVFEEDFKNIPKDLEDRPYIDGEERYGDMVCLNPEMDELDWDNKLSKFGFYLIDLEHGWLNLFKPAYSNYQEAENEIRNRMSGYLPDDFNYKNRMVEYWGTCYC